MDILDSKHNFDIPEGMLEEEFNLIWHKVEHAKKDGKLDEDDKKLSEKKRLAKELDDIILNNISQKVASILHSSKSYSEYLKKVQEKKIDPFEAADNISKGILK